MSYLVYAMSMNSKILLLTLLLTPVLVQAQIYKSVDEEGNTVYRDTPDDNAEEFVVPSLNTIPMPRWQAPAADKEEPEEAAFRYTTLAISSPSADQTLFINTGNVPVNIVVQPTLRQDDSLRVLLDGSRVVNDSRELSHLLNNVDRGEHRLQVEIVDKKGKRLQSSAEIRFFLRRKSSLQSQSVIGPRNSLGKPIFPGPNTAAFQQTEDPR